MGGVTDSSSDDDDDSSLDNDHHHRKRKRHRQTHTKRDKKEKKEKKKKDKRAKKKSSKKTNQKSSRKRGRRDDDHSHHSNDRSSSSTPSRRTRRPDPRTLTADSGDSTTGSSYALADALCRLLDDHPAMAEDLPAILVRLASGTTLNFSQSPVQSHLSAVLRLLRPYGVYQEEENDKNDDLGVWKFRPLVPNMAAATNNNKKTDELVLIRVVRSLLDQMGVTMDALQRSSVSSGNHHVDNPDDDGGVVSRQKEEEEDTKRSDPVPEEIEEEETKQVEHRALLLIRSFGASDLAQELVALCGTILDGEVISLAGLPDQRLREALHHLLHDTCGMIPTEMDHESDDDDDNDNDGDEDEVPTTGLGLPDDAMLAQRVARRIQVVRQVCGQQAERVTKGPLPRLALDHDADDDDDDDGPLLPGLTRRSFGEASAPAEAVLGAEGGREEWMLVPGKFDLLTGLKSSGEVTRNRQFSGKRGADSDANAAPMNPKIEAEIRALREEHEASRGPSLMEEHRLRKEQKDEETRQQKRKGQKTDWKWDRSTDLDAGRRVDTDALNMMMGGANSTLRDKFHSGT
jgi:Protein of unknown function (DUF3752)